MGNADEYKLNRGTCALIEALIELEREAPPKEELITFLLDGLSNQQLREINKTEDLLAFNASLLTGFLRRLYEGKPLDIGDVNPEWRNDPDLRKATAILLFQELQRAGVARWMRELKTSDPFDPSLEPNQLAEVRALDQWPPVILSEPARELLRQTNPNLRVTGRRY